MVSSALLGGMLGSIFTATLGSKLGRKTELLVSSVLYGPSVQTGTNIDASLIKDLGFWSPRFPVAVQCSAWAD